MRLASRLAPAEDNRVGGELAVVSIGHRGSPANPGADVAEVALEQDAAVEARVHPAPDHLARGVLVAQDLGELPASLPLGVAGPLDPAMEAPLALASVSEAVLGEHRPGVTPGGELQPVVGLEQVAVALRALAVDQTGDRLAYLGKGDLTGMSPGMGTGGGGRGDPGPKGEGRRDASRRRRKREQRRPPPWRPPCRRINPGHPTKG